MCCFDFDVSILVVQPRTDACPFLGRAQHCKPISIPRAWSVGKKFVRAHVRRNGYCESAHQFLFARIHDRGARYLDIVLDRDRVDRSARIFFHFSVCTRFWGIPNVCHGFTDLKKLVRMNQRR